MLFRSDRVRHPTLSKGEADLETGGRLTLEGKSWPVAKVLERGLTEYVGGGSLHLEGSNSLYHLSNLTFQKQSSLRRRGGFCILDVGENNLLGSRV